MGNSSSESQRLEYTCESAKVVPSKPPPTPPTPKQLMDKPWRKLPNYGKEFEEEAKRDIMNIQLVEKAKVLLVGHVGAGKSSFINSCLSVGIGRKCQLAATGNASNGIGSWTYKFQDYDDNLLMKSVAFADCMGIETGDREGFNEYDMVKLLKGHIKEGYKFNPKFPIQVDDKYYMNEPKYTDKIHCVVFVLSANAVYHGISQNITNKITRIQEDILEEDISRMLVLTKADLLCEEVKGDASNIYRSVKVFAAIRRASELFSIPIGSIHPVVNFENDINLSTEMSIPILLALRQIVENAYDRVHHDHKKGKDNY